MLPDITKMETILIIARYLVWNIRRDQIEQYCEIWSVVNPAILKDGLQWCQYNLVRDRRLFDKLFVNYNIYVTLYNVI